MELVVGQQLLNADVGADADTILPLLNWRQTFSPRMADAGGFLFCYIL